MDENGNLYTTWILNFITITTYLTILQVNEVLFGHQLLCLLCSIWYVTNDNIDQLLCNSMLSEVKDYNTYELRKVIFIKISTFMLKCSILFVQY